MAGLRGNIAWLAWAKQTVKGTPVTPYLFRTAFTGGSLSPSREVDQLSETDASRDQGRSYVQQTGTSGSPEVYCRTGYAHSLLELAFGTKVTSGAANFTHTLTPGNTIPYATFARGISDTLWEQFNDCKVSELTVSADAGQPLTMGLDLMGRAAIRATAEPASLPAMSTTEDPSNFNQAAVTLGAGATSLIGSFDMTYTNNVSVQQTDDSVPYDVVEGLREVTLGFDLIFETLDEYNKFHYGGAAGTAQSASIFTTNAEFTFTQGANNEVKFTFPVLAYEEFPVDPDPGGDPIVVPVRARAQRSGSPIVTAVVKNQASA